MVDDRSQGLLTAGTQGIHVAEQHNRGWENAASAKCLECTVIKSTPTGARRLVLDIGYRISDIGSYIGYRIGSDIGIYFDTIPKNKQNESIYTDFDILGRREAFVQCQHDTNHYYRGGP